MHFACCDYPGYMYTGQCFHSLLQNGFKWSEGDERGKDRLSRRVGCVFACLFTLRVAVLRINFL